MMCNLKSQRTLALIMVLVMWRVKNHGNYTQAKEDPPHLFKGLQKVPE